MNRMRGLLSYRAISVAMTIVVTSLLRTSDAHANWTPHMVATAGASRAFSSGLEASFANPALLGISASRDLQLRIVGAGAGVTSNGLGWDEYRKYNGAALSADDKTDILNHIPVTGLQMTADAGATALAFRYGQFSVRADGAAAGGGRLDRDAVELLLYGNANQPDWSFDDSDAEGLASWNLRVAYGLPVAHARNHAVYIGGSVAYVRGLYYGRAEDARADLLTATTGLTGIATGEVYTAEGGNGVSVDLGAAVELGQQWTAGLTVENVIHSVRWATNTEVTHYYLQFDDLTVDNFDDSLWISNDTREALDGFSRGLPARVRASLGHTTDHWRIGTTVTVDADSRLSYSTTPELAAGVEYDLLPNLPARLGGAIGGVAGPSFGWGGGVRMWRTELNVGFRVDRGVWPGYGRGLTAALALDVSL